MLSTPLAKEAKELCPLPRIPDVGFAGERPRLLGYVTAWLGGGLDILNGRILLKEERQ